MVWQARFEVGHELGAAVDLDAVDLEGHVGDELVEEGGGEVGGGAACDAGDGPFGDRIVGGEVARPALVQRPALHGTVRAPLRRINVG